jgi:transcriptional regulator with XRE-family HTH domain
MVSAIADRHAAALAERLGAALRDARRQRNLTQTAVAARAGFDQVTWSRLERGRDPRFTLATWDRAAHAVGTALNAYLPQTSAATLPRDAVQLRNQELVIRLAKPGAWRPLPEQQIDREARTSRWADVLLERRHAHAPTEYCICEIWDWIADVGGSVRDFSRRLDALDRYGVARMRGDETVPRTGGIWLLRATRRNRELVNEHRNFFRSRFPGSGRAWLAALTDQAAPMPSDPSVLWVDVGGTRIFAARLG